MNYWSTHFVFNLVEGFWWIGLGVWIFLYYSQSRSESQGPSCSQASGCRIPGSSPGQALSGVTTQKPFFFAIILILFGVSDFVEMVTGAWWQPWWLGVWKGLCIGVGLILFILIYKESRWP